MAFASSHHERALYVGQTEAEGPELDGWSDSESSSCSSSDYSE